MRGNVIDNAEVPYSNLHWASRRAVNMLTHAPPLILDQIRRPSGTPARSADREHVTITRNGMAMGRDHAIEGALYARLQKAKDEHAAARDRFDAVLKEGTGSAPHPDGTLRVEMAGSESSTTLRRSHGRAEAVYGFPHERHPCRMT